jgi:hypothetical protein
MLILTTVLERFKMGLKETEFDCEYLNEYMGFSWFPCVYKRMLRWFPSFQVATTCFSCSPSDLNFLVTFYSYLCKCKITTATG